MRNLTLIFVFLFSLTSPLSAETLKDQRRLEEEARDDLRFTEPQPSVISEPVLEDSSFIDLSFFQELLSKTYLVRCDAIRPVLILLDEEEVMSGDQAAQIHFLKEKNILPARVAVDFSPEKPLRKGLLAYMFCQALGMKGGIGARIFGMNQRYALNELVFAGVMPEGSKDDVVSGPEFISFFTKAAEYLAQKNEAAKGKILKKDL
ncbi:MAG: hypothetical protein AMJ95_00155 [Omnitrophica WOR_2 bacterium SM23_72]|nr:MAG: hypothetical protein AMJ95_00155 [Omnitrophica WOR_2 bacterium SM23_72]